MAGLVVFMAGWYNKIIMFDYLSIEVFNLTTVYKLLIIVHLIGLALGAGAAFFSDFLFTHILKDRIIRIAEFNILKLASSVVWIGLSVLVASGLAIFLGDTERLLDSPKFLAKMTIVFTLFVNGLLFHFIHLPRIEKLLGKDLSKSKLFMNNYANSFFISGAVSGVSWMAALVLGGIGSIDLSYLTIMGLYLLAVAASVPAAFLLKKKFLGSN